MIQHTTDVFNCSPGASAKTAASRMRHPPRTRRIEFGARGRSAVRSSFASLRTGLRGQVAEKSEPLSTRSVGVDRPAAIGPKAPISIGGDRAPTSLFSIRFLTGHHNTQNVLQLTIDFIGRMMFFLMVDVCHHLGDVPSADDESTVENHPFEAASGESRLFIA